MKILTLHQPYASLLAMGIKNSETRNWKTDYRGPIAIHAAKKKPSPADLAFFQEMAKGQIYGQHLMPRFALGRILAIADLADCQEIDRDLILAQSGKERLMGDWREGRFAFRIENPRPLYLTIHWRSRQGKLLVVPEELRRIIEAELQPAGSPQDTHIPCAETNIEAFAFAEDE